LKSKVVRNRAVYLVLYCLYIVFWRWFGILLLSSVFSTQCDKHTIIVVNVFRQINYRTVYLFMLANL